MRRRVLTAIVAVTLLATLVLTVPLTLLIAAREHEDADQELALAAERGANELTFNDLNSGGLRLPTFERALSVAVYAPDGRRLAGNGPRTADRFTQATKLLTRTGTTSTTRILVRPVVDNEVKVAMIRVAEPLAEAERRAWRDIAILLGIDVAAVAIAAAVGAWVSTRLVRPLTAIRDDAIRLGDGDFSIEPAPSGIAELDDTAAALAETASRLNGILQRERAFTADASHQLRTPLTSLRLAIETELATPSTDPTPMLEEALGEIDRLEDTISTLLSVARDQPISREPLDLADWLADVERRWSLVATERQRLLHCTCTGDAHPHVSRAVLDHVTDVLVSNAIQHGQGTVSVTVESEPDGAALTVADVGRLHRNPGDLFTRRDPGASGHGVGLSLARTLAEAEGGRLTIVSTSPTTFRLVLPGRGLTGDRTAP
ncbi:MAG TPA: HAMP domain-containing sensor histidine kinase [Microthrixaceae bacterium]|jgi:signal transduction histidine kinase|nr:HAMP domain-containing sensor histidine kinase [Microthrixaceae bacterium]HQF94582.1 HAMP domain-containing sensor histidine kinase [Microthrixaceae bacterium]